MVSQTQLTQAYDFFASQSGRDVATIEDDTNVSRIMCMPGFSDQYSIYLKKRKKAEKTHRYLVTFTFDPKKLPAAESDYPDFFDIAEQYIENLAFSRQYSATHWAVVREHHAPPRDKICHFHVSVVSSKILKKSFFRYYVKTYGNIDISKSRVNTTEFAINYMQKENEPTLIL